MAARELPLCPPPSSADQSPKAQGPSTGMSGQGWTLALQRAFCFVSSCAGPGLMKDSALTREPTHCSDLHLFCSRSASRTVSQDFLASLSAVFLFPSSTTFSGPSH